MCPTGTFWDSTNLDDLTDYRRGEKSDAQEGAWEMCSDEGYLIAENFNLSRSFFKTFCKTKYKIISQKVFD